MINPLRLPSVKHQFSTVPHADIQRSSFKRNHGYKTTFDAGYLIPIFVDEALPGDTFNLSMSAVARLATPVYPIMDNLRIDYFFFAVPNRLLWSNWQRFMGERDPDPDSSIDYTVPQVVGASSGGFPLGGLADYMGVPIEVNSLSINALHHRAYRLIWNQWFRDENLQDSQTVSTGDGPDAVATDVLLKRGKRHDYFTSCMPTPQKGTAIDLPLGTTAPVTGIGKSTQTFAATNSTSYETGASASTSYASYSTIYGEQANNTFHIEEDPNNSGYPGIYADLSEATAATINDIREAFQLQRMLERDMRGGTRYVEVIKSHFNVDSPDFRMQRPEYLGGGSAPIQISPIPQTSESGTTAQGTLAAIGFHQTNGIGFTKSFDEHCVILGLACCVADLTYQQGLDRMFSRSTRYDYYWPALAHLGEQEVYNKEIYCDGSANDILVFGYQERWAEYRYKNSRITGKLRSDATGSLDAWHLSIDFASLPSLNASFIQESPPIDRVVAVTTEPDLIFDSFFNLTCARPMPVRSVPGLIDHF